MSDDENPDNAAPEEGVEEEAHDEHDEHTFPSYANGFIAVFGWLVFFTIIEVMAILQEFSFSATMFILFSIAFVKVWFIASFFMHLRWDPPLVSYTHLRAHDTSLLLVCRLLPVSKHYSHVLALETSALRGWGWWFSPLN